MRDATDKALKPVAVIELTGIDDDGELLASPAVWRGRAPPPLIRLASGSPATQPVLPALGPGDRLLARLLRHDDGSYEARPIRRLEARPKRVVGVYERERGKGRLRPADRRTRDMFAVADIDAGGAEPGEVVLAQLFGHRRSGLGQARVVERLGRLDDPRTASAIAVQSFAIPTEFTADAVAEAAAAELPTVAGRTDLTGLALVTIDDEDARDFDDAIWAEPDADPDNPDGWHMVVAIADVGWYVRPGGALDRCARDRGNSVYFPDRVVPMLPETLSNGMCSLRPGEPRACLAVHLWIGADGRARRHRFVRGIMRSAARLTYTQVQHALDGAPDAAAAPLVTPVLRPLDGAYRALFAARERRGTIDLDLPERHVAIDADGRIGRISHRARLESHRLIEEFMIAANIAAAETLEEKGFPCVYRAHESPAPEKVAELREVLAGIGFRLAPGRVLQPRHFADLVNSAKGSPQQPMVQRAVLRSQAKAVYSPDNPGHFALALRHYAHFTSPIRRYADLLVHRSLIAALELGPGGLGRDGAPGLTQTATHISMTERRAASAEREAVDRLTAAYLADRIGSEFAARLSAVTRFGVFLTLEETGADGLVPASRLREAGYRTDVRALSLIPAGGGDPIGPGDRLNARLENADPLTGNLTFSLTRPDARRHGRVQPQRRPKGRRHGG